MKKKLFLLILFMQAMNQLPASAEIRVSSEKATVRGTVRFEQRTGIAPGSLRPTPYWGMVVYSSNGTAYELSYILGANKAAPPNEFVVQGVPVREGEEIAIEGKVQKIRKDFGLMSEVGRVRVLHR